MVSPTANDAAIGLHASPHPVFSTSKMRMVTPKKEPTSWLRITLAGYNMNAIQAFSTTIDSASLSDNRAKPKSSAINL